MRHSRHVEPGAEFGALCAAPHEFAAAPLAQDQPEGVDQDRLACPGLARQYGHARLEVDLDAVDNREVPYVQADQHVYSPSGGKSRLRES